MPVVHRGPPWPPMASRGPPLPPVEWCPGNVRCAPWPPVASRRPPSPRVNFIPCCARPQICTRAVASHKIFSALGAALNVHKIAVRGHVQFIRYKTVFVAPNPLADPSHAAVPQRCEIKQSHARSALEDAKGSATFYSEGAKGSATC